MTNEKKREEKKDVENIYTEMLFGKDKWMKLPKWRYRKSEKKEKIKKKKNERTNERNALIVVIENCDGIICSACSRAKHTFEPFIYFVKYGQICLNGIDEVQKLNNTAKEWQFVSAPNTEQNVFDRNEY